MRIKWIKGNRPKGWPCFDLDKDGNEIKPGHSFKFKVSISQFRSFKVELK